MLDKGCAHLELSGLQSRRVAGNRRDIPAAKRLVGEERLSGGGRFQEQCGTVRWLHGSQRESAAGVEEQAQGQREGNDDARESGHFEWRRRFYAEPATRG